MDSVQRWIWYANIAVTAALVLRLAVGGLFRTYRLLFAYLLIDLVQQALGLAAGTRGNAYAYIYMIGQAAKLAVAFFVVLELYRLALSSHPALAAFGKRTAGYLLAGAALVAAVGLTLGSSVPRGQSPVLHRFFTFERTMDLSIVIFLVLISVFMTWFPVRMRRNVVLYIGGFGIFFLVRSAGLFLANVLSPSSTVTLSVALLGVSLGCLVVWLAGLTQAGEQVTTMVGHRWDPGSIDRLQGQLDSINASLVRLSRQASVK